MYARTRYIGTRNNPWLIISQSGENRFSFDNYCILCERKKGENERREMADAKKTCGRGELKANPRGGEEPFSSLALISFA